MESPGSAVSFKSIIASPTTPLSHFRFYEILDNEINESPYLCHMRSRSQKHFLDETSAYLNKRKEKKDVCCQCSPVKIQKQCDIGVQCDLVEGFFQRVFSVIITWFREGMEQCENWLSQIREEIRKKFQWEKQKLGKQKTCTTVPDQLAERMDAIEKTCQEMLTKQQEILTVLTTLELEKKNRKEGQPLIMGGLPPPPPPPPLPSIAPPPPPPLPMFINSTSKFLKSPQQKKKEVTKGTPRPTITAEDLASVRLRKVSLSENKKNNFAGQMVTVEQLRSVKLKPRRKTAPINQSPTRTPSGRDRLRKRTRPRRDLMPLSSILNLEDTI